jgi:hypothetical protein
MYAILFFICDPIAQFGGRVASRQEMSGVELPPKTMDS